MLLIFFTESQNEIDHFTFCISCFQLTEKDRVVCVKKINERLKLSYISGIDVHGTQWYYTVLCLRRIFTESTCQLQAAMIRGVVISLPSRSEEPSRAALMNFLNCMWHNYSKAYRPFYRTHAKPLIQ